MDALPFPKGIPTKLTMLSTHHRKKSLSLPDSYRPSQFDICSGRGKSYTKHEGNIWFRSLIRENAPKYVIAPSKASKTRVVADLVEHIRSAGGKFLKQNVSLHWEDMDDKQARGKVGHALRDFVSKGPGQAIGQVREARRRHKRVFPAVVQSFSPEFSDAETTTMPTFEPLDFRSPQDEVVLRPSELSHLDSLTSPVEAWCNLVTMPTAIFSVSDTSSLISDNSDFEDNNLLIGEQEDV